VPPPAWQTQTTSQPQVMALPELELPHSYDDLDLEIEIGQAQREIVYQTVDQVMAQWPPLAEVRERLCQELAAEIDPAGLAASDLASRAAALLDQYWQAGGGLSATAYTYAYKARILLEIAHQRQPEDGAITDQLVDAIQATWLRTRRKADTGQVVMNPTDVETLLELRSRQCRRIRAEVSAGRAPAWDDLLKMSDEAWLLHRCKQYEEAAATVQWLLEHADPGGWGVYTTSLKSWRDSVTQHKPVFSFVIFASAVPDAVDRHLYTRRLPSFKGPDPERRGIVPMQEWARMQVSKARDGSKEHGARPAQGGGAGQAAAGKPNVRQE
jgi:hypothetical protein